MSKNKEQDLKEFADFRDYVLSVISVGVAMGRGTISPARLEEERTKLAAHEAKLVGIIKGKDL